MTDREDEIRAVAEKNVEIVMERGPGLYMDTGVFVIARDRKKPAVLLGGLGCMGVGEMWFLEAGALPETDYPGLDYSRHPGYADAPEAVWYDEIAALDEVLLRRDAR